jgi:hypothetical protein
MKEDKMSGACSMQWNVKQAHKISVRKPKGKKLFGRWKDNIKVKLEEIQWALMNAGMVLWIL